MIEVLAFKKYLIKKIFRKQKRSKQIYIVFDAFRRTPLILLIILLFGFHFNDSYAQTFNSLLSTQLDVEEDLSPMGFLNEASEEALRIKLYEGGMTNAKIDGIIVTDETKNRLSLDINYSGFQSESYVYAEILGLNRKRLVQIRPCFTVLQPDQDFAVLNFVINERQARKSQGEFKSGHLKIVVVHPFTDKVPLKEILNEMVESKVSIFAGAIDALGLTTLYKLPKTWKSTTASTKPTKITVTLKPIGKANSINADTKQWPRYNPPNTYIEKNIDRESKGPSNQSISLWEDIKTDVDFASPEDVSAIRMMLYQDLNPASGVFYYLPHSYHLRWDNYMGPYIRMTYSGLNENQAGPGDVLMSASLTPSITQEEIETMRSLLDVYCAAHGQLNPSLRAMPLLGAPSVSFALGSLYQIPTDQINVVVGASILDPIQVQWKTNSKIKDDIEVHLVENLGIRGSAQITPQAEGLPEMQLPVRITLTDFGRLDLNPRDWYMIPWKNHTGYPLKLQKMHRLIIRTIGNRQVPHIYSWSLGDVEIPDNAEVTFTSDRIPRWLDRKEYTKRLWLEFKVLPCWECDERIFEEKIDSAPTQSGSRAIVFETNVMESFGIEFMEVKVRSIQGDPRRKKLVELPTVRITQDETEVPGGFLYVPRGGVPRFEYKIRIIKADETFESKTWVASRNLNVFINLSELKKSFENLKDLK